MPGKNAVDVYLAVGLRGRDLAQLEQPIFKAYYFLTANIQTISKTKTHVKKKLAGRLILHDDRQRNLNLETNYIDWKIQVKTKHGLELKVPLRENVGIKTPLTSKMARHTLAVALINSGSSVYSVSRILGHNSTASVEKTYAHLLQESAEVDLERCMKEAFEKR